MPRSYRCLSALVGEGVMTVVLSGFGALTKRVSWYSYTRRLPL